MVFLVFGCALNSFLLGEELLISLYFRLYYVENVLDSVETGLLAHKLLFDVLHSLSVLVVEVLEGIDDVHVLVGD